MYINNNVHVVDGGSEKTQQNHNNDIYNTDQKVEQDNPQFPMVKFQNVMIHPLKSSSGCYMDTLGCQNRSPGRLVKLCVANQ